MYEPRHIPASHRLSAWLLSALFALSLCVQQAWAAPAERTVIPLGQAVGVPARVVRIGGQKVSNCNEQLDQIHMADPVSMELCRLRGELERLQNQVNEMESRGKTPE